MKRLSLLAAVLAAVSLGRPAPGLGGPIKVGVIFSQTGTMAPSESPLVDATRLAIDEINAQGGVLGRQLQPVVLDGASTPATFAGCARTLLEKDGVCALFGCWTSDSRRAVLPVLKEHDGVLFYPAQYEGEEQNPQVIYTGMTANQQLFPALDWMTANYGGKVYLVGSQSLWSRTLDRITRLYLGSGSVLGEDLQPLGSTDYEAVARRVVAAHPKFVLLSQNLASTAAFCTAVHALDPDLPLLSLSVGELELSRMKPVPAGLYLAHSYFMGLNTPANRRFVKAFRTRYGPDRVVDDNAQTAYFQVKAFAQAVTLGGSTEPAAVRKAARGLIFEAPAGLLRIDPETQHIWKSCRLGRVQPSGSINIVWSSELPIRPRPFPEAERQHS